MKADFGKAKRIQDLSNFCASAPAACFVALGGAALHYQQLNRLYGRETIRLQA